MTTGGAEKERIREPIADGLLYPAEEKELTDRIASLVEEVEIDRRDAFGIITPHASYEYVGPLMARAFTSAAGRVIKTVVILAPIHRDDDGDILLPESRYFQTPLGVLSVNEALIEELLGCSTAIIRNDVPYLEEHAIEVQLPFIQFLFPECSIVPVMMGRGKPRNVKVLANALRLSFSDRFDEVLFVATTNMSSYKAKDRSAEEANLLRNLIGGGDASRIVQDVSNKKISAHGALCAAALLSLGDFESSILGDLSSDSVLNDRFKAIHYAAISLYQRE